MNHIKAISLLGLKASFTTKELKSAYRSKAMAAHPDRGGSVAQMQDINAAYSFLVKSGPSNSDLRNDRVRRDEMYAEYWELVDSLFEQFSLVSYTEYLSAHFGCEISATIKTQKRSLYAGATNYFSLVEFANSDRSVVAAVHFSVDLMQFLRSDILSEGIEPENSGVQFGLAVELFAAERDHKMAIRRYVGLKTLKCLNDPKSLFPAAKLKKIASGQVIRPVKKADTLSFFKWGLGGAIFQANSASGVELKPAEGVNVLLYRGVMMKTGYIRPGPVKTKVNGCVQNHHIRCMSLPETDETLRIIKKAYTESLPEGDHNKGQFNHDHYISVISDYYESLLKAA